MANYGIKIGDDLNSDADKDLKFTSKYGTLKIFAQGEITLNTDGSGDGSAYFEHGLGYAPAFLVFKKDTASWPFMDASTHPDVYIPVGTLNDWTYYSDSGFIHAYTTSSRIYIIADGAQPSQTYVYKYYLLVERSEAFTDPPSITLNKNYGMKVALPGKNVLTGKEYDMGYSSKYKSIQYYEESLQEETLTLPLMYSSLVDPDVEEGTYVDFEHGLGYPPLFMAFARSSLNSTDTMIEIPYAQTLEDAGDSWEYQISAFCDDEKVRVSFYRRDSWNDVDDTPSNIFLDEAIVIKLFVFTEDLSA